MPGPFDEYLQQGYQPTQQVRPTHADGASSIMNFASQFLQGASQARAQKFAESEKQRAGNIAALQNMMVMAKDQGLAPAAYQQFQAKIMQRLAAEIAHTDDGSKGTGKQGGGNPFFNFVKGAATNLLGGNVQKTKPLSEEELGTYFKELQGMPRLADIQKQSSQLMAEALEDVKTRTQGMYTQRDLLAHPKMMEGLKLAEANGFDPPPTFKALMGSAMTQDQVNETNALGKFANMWGGGGQPQQAPAQAAPAAPPQPGVQHAMTIPGQPLGIPQASASLPQLQNDNDVPSEMSGSVAPNLGPSPDVAVRADLGALPSAEPPRGSLPSAPAAPALQRVATSVGQEQVPGILGPRIEMPVEVRGYLARKGVKPSTYFLQNPTTGDYLEVEDWGPGRTLKVGTNERVNVDVAARQGYRQTPTLTATERSMTPEAIKKSRAATLSVIDEHPDLNPQEKAAAKRIYEAQIASGDVKGASDSVNSHIASVVAKKERIAREAQARADRQAAAAERGSIKDVMFVNTLSNNIDKMQPVKDYDTVVNYANQMESAYKQANNPNNKAIGIADVNLIRGAAKISDPPSTVREGEQEVYTKAQGLYNRFRSLLDQDPTKGPLLSHEARQEFIQMAREIRAIQRKNVVDAIGPKLRIAKSQNIPYEQVLRESLYDVGDAVYSNHRGSTATAEPPKASGGGTNNNPFPKPKGF